MRFSTFIVALLLSGSVFAGTSKTLTLNVQNMSCAACPITVKKAHEKVPGVSDVKIDFERKTATMHLDTDKANVLMLTKATTEQASLRLSGNDAMTEVVLESVLTCPHCRLSKQETMPTDTCQFYYACESCAVVLRPKTGDWCVFCSYGTAKCPPIQLERPCCG